MNAAIAKTSRQTKYIKAVSDALERYRHATNLELLDEVRKLYPEVSATTIHRVTSRLWARGVIGCAPKSPNGAERYDINPKPHHHFTCTNCNRICDVPDTSEAKQIIRQLQNLSNQCVFVSTMVMSGTCKRCANQHMKEKYENNNV